MNAIRTMTLAAVVAGAAQAQGTVPGWTLTMKTTVDSGGANPTVVSVKMAGAGKKMRQQINVRGQDVVSIVDAEAGTMTAVMEQMGMAMITKPSTFGGLMPKSSV